MMEEWISLDPVVPKDDGSITNLEIKVTYVGRTTSSSFSEMDVSWKVSISSDDHDRNEPTGTRISANCKTKEEYAQLIRYFSSSPQKSIVSCASYDALIWKSHSYFTVTDDDNNNNFITSYLPQEQLSSCHWMNLLTNLSRNKKKKLSPSQQQQQQQQQWSNPKIWMEYNTSFTQQGISYFMTLSTNTQRLEWNDLIIYPITHNNNHSSSSSSEGRIIHVNVHKDLVPFVSETTTTFYLDEQKLNTFIFNTSHPLSSSSSFTPPSNHKPFMMMEMEKFIIRNHGVTNHGTFQTNLHYTTTIHTSDNKTTNNKTLSIVEYIPTLVQPIWHSLRLIHNNDTNLLALQEKIHSKKITSINSNYYKLELTLPLPNESSSLFQLSFDYDYTLLSYDAYPPDPNKGIPLPPSHAILEGQTFYSNSVLLMIPVPDMSMPFNVIAVTSTLQLFVFACLLNFAIRKASQTISDKINKKKRKPTWKEKVRAKLQRLFPSQQTIITSSSSTTASNDSPEKMSPNKEKNE